eukprot:gnl/TRDRNA2_/TRDRNA2_149184_c1_seq2.p2 gnl/TRDRNA2_/TRDRNA2_149184_c1~~gnl/TRDRNA2_/TRDRNA2_149184_c1_seq2.p2  ORF type:complete len:126 (-),score=22.61 gnl/TRDRNA2_/TRDRNA2_149184_c1_seq2:128-505(-)
MEATLLTACGAGAVASLCHLFRCHSAGDKGAPVIRESSSSPSDGIETGGSAAGAEAAPPAKMCAADEIGELKWAGPQWECEDGSDVTEHIMGMLANQKGCVAPFVASPEYRVRCLATRQLPGKKI